MFTSVWSRVCDVSRFECCWRALALLGLPPLPSCPRLGNMFVHDFSWHLNFWTSQHLPLLITRIRHRSRVQFFRSQNSDVVHWHFRCFWANEIEILQSHQRRIRSFIGCVPFRGSLLWRDRISRSRQIALSFYLHIENCGVCVCVLWNHMALVFIKYSRCLGAVLSFSRSTKN